MEWVKLTTNYYLDAAIMRAGEEAEVLFTRALAYVGDQETDGFVPREALPRLCPTRGPSRAAALVREGLWDLVRDGWQFCKWHEHQKTAEQMKAKRQAGRARQSKYRSTRAGDAVSNAVTNASVTRTEVEEEVDAAAAARDTPPSRPTGRLTPAVEILRAALEAHRLEVRWDTLTADQVTTVETLIEVHGDAALVRDALRAYQPNRPPVYATAWLSGWQQLRPPGSRPQLVADPCAQPGHSGTTKHCTQCASEQKAAR